MTREVLQMALEALENHSGNYKLTDAECDTQEAVLTAIKEVLAKQDAEAHLQAISDFGQEQEQEQEPCKQSIHAALRSAISWGRNYADKFGLPQWQKIREQQIDRLMNDIYTSPLPPKEKS